MFGCRHGNGVCADKFQRFDYRCLTTEERYVTPVDCDGLVRAPKEPRHTHSHHAETVCATPLEVSCKFSAGILAAHHQYRCEALPASTPSHDHPTPEPTAHQ